MALGGVRAGDTNYAQGPVNARSGGPSVGYGGGGSPMPPPPWMTGGGQGGPLQQAPPQQAPPSGSGPFMDPRTGQPMPDSGGAGGGGSSGGGGAGGGGGGGSTTPGAPPPLSNTTTDDPDIRWQIEQYKSRLTAAPEQRAIQQATSNIRDASSGLQKELGGNLASRGMLGSGVESQMRNQLGEQALRGIGKAGADIAIQRQGDLDKMVLGGESLMKAPSEGARAQQGLGLQQYGLQQQGDIARAQLEQQGQIAAQQMQMEQQRLAMQQQQQTASLWGQYMQMYL